MRHTITFASDWMRANHECGNQQSFEKGSSGMLLHLFAFVSVKIKRKKNVKQRGSTAAPALISCYQDGTIVEDGWWVTTNKRRLTPYCLNMLHFGTCPRGQPAFHGPCSSGQLHPHSPLPVTKIINTDMAFHIIWLCYDQQSR